jgi:hypothetical protein
MLVCILQRFSYNPYLSLTYSRLLKVTPWPSKNWERKLKNSTLLLIYMMIRLKNINRSNREVGRSTLAESSRRCLTINIQPASRIIQALTANNFFHQKKTSRIKLNNRSTNIFFKTACQPTTKWMKYQKIKVCCKAIQARNKRPHVCRSKTWKGSKNCSLGLLTFNQSWS